MRERWRPLGNLEWRRRLFEALTGDHPLTKVLPSLVGGETTYFYEAKVDRWLGVIRYERTDDGVLAEPLPGFSNLAEALRQEWAEDEGFASVKQARAVLGRPPETARLILWAEDPYRYSPIVDEVAIERALQFDRKAIEQLSSEEWYFYIETLAGMEDPFDREASAVPLTQVAKLLGFTGSMKGDSLGAPQLQTNRRRRYLELPETLRTAIGKAVRKRGGSATRIAA